MNVRTAFRRSRRRTGAWLAGLIVLLAAAIVGGVMAGSVPIPPGDIAAVLHHHLFAGAAASPTTDAIIWQVRLPRVVLGAFAGAGLAVAGIALQAMVRNALADPYVLGINSGASVGAALALLFGVGAGFSSYGLQASAFLGAAGAMALVLLVARGRASALRLLLAGVAVGYALAAATSFLVFAADSAEGSRSVMFWLLGSLGLAAWDLPLAITCAAVTLGTAVAWSLSRQLDALAIGDDTALSLGMSPSRLRLGLLLLTSLIVGCVVAAAGSIGFVGLVVPHLARRLVGASHRHAIPVAALLGACLMTGADILARTILAPQEIPIGVITALVGTPLLLAHVRSLRA